MLLRRETGPLLLLGEIIRIEILALKLPYVIFLDQLNPLVFT